MKPAPCNNVRLFVSKKLSTANVHVSDLDFDLFSPVIATLKNSWFTLRFIAIQCQWAKEGENGRERLDIMIQVGLTNH